MRTHAANHCCYIAFGNKRQRAAFPDNGPTRNFSIWSGTDHTRNEPIPSKD
jgi:hypothetical protein